MKNNITLIEKFDWNLLNKYIEEGLIYANKHKKYDLWILNYTPLTTYGKLWNEYSLACRGLVIDKDGNVVARPFTKFKNFEEHDISEIDLDDDYEVFEKMDGSLGILFYYNVTNEWILATRGSFESEQAVEGMKILNERLTNYDWLQLSRDITYLFEIIYPQNRIVVDYDGLRDMVLLGMMETSTGYEYPYSHVESYKTMFAVVRKYDFPKVTNLNDLRMYSEDNKEGFVLRFSNGFRVKVKFLDYCRLHSIITNVSNVSIWEMLRNNSDLNTIISNVPDEFYEYVKKTISDLKNKYAEIELNARNDIVTIKSKLNDVNDKKEFALEAVKYNNCGLIFAINNGKEYTDTIWKMVRPKWSKPFKIVSEE